jgi:hypothetical protein
VIRGVATLRIKDPEIGRVVVGTDAILVVDNLVARERSAEKLSGYPNVLIYSAVVVGAWVSRRPHLDVAMRCCVTRLRGLSGHRTAP